MNTLGGYTSGLTIDPVAVTVRDTDAGTLTIEVVGGTTINEGELYRIVTKANPRKGLM